MPDPSNLLHQGRTPYHQNAGKGSAWVQEMGVYAKRVEIRTVGDVTTIYKAWAEYGTLESAADWMIVQVILDASVELDVTEGIAGGVINEFTFAWTGRAGFAYS